MTALTERYALAVDYARIAHAGQVRKGTQIPYLSHLLGVSTLVLECGGDEEQAIAGLLHDVVEDCGGGHEASIRAQFGDAVADIVMACTDATAEDKAEVDNTDSARKRDWRERKLAYLDHLRNTPERALLVSGCDKLYNARTIVQDLENPAVGQDYLQRVHRRARRHAVVLRRAGSDLPHARCRHRAVVHWRGDTHAGLGRDRRAAGAGAGARAGLIAFYAADLRPGSRALARQLLRNTSL